MAKWIKKRISTLARHSIMQSAISLALLIAIIGFFCTTNASRAWFAQSNEVSANGMSVSVKVTADTVATLRSYPILKIEGNAYTISYENESYTLPTNDPNEISYSAFKKALAIIIDITAEHEQDIHVAISASTGLESLPLESNFLSNCISVKRATLSGAGNDIATTTGDAETFISLDGAEAIKADEIILETMQAVQNTTVCYIIEYDRSLLEYIHHAIQAAHPNVDFVTYANDLDFIIY